MLVPMLAVGPSRAGAWTAFLVPFVLYSWTASPFGYWLDSPEFLAQAVGMGISHPPGHPLTGLVTGLYRLLPLGPISLRVGWLCGLCMAAASLMAYRAADRMLDRLAVPSDGVRAAMALATALAWAGMPGLWISAVRPEVYGPQALICAALLNEMLALGDGREPLRPHLIRAALLCALGAANHHLLTLLTLVAGLPLLLPRLASVVRATPLPLSVGLWTLALLYAYLPLRAAAGPVPNLGAPTSLSRLWWVVSAQVFQKSTDGEGGARGHSPAALFDNLGEQLGPVLILSLGGAYLMLRKGGTRSLGLGLLTSAAVPLAMRWNLGHVWNNPDASAYLMVAYLAMVLMAVGLCAILVQAIGRPVTAGVVALALLAAGGYQLSRGMALGSLADFRMIDAVDQAARRNLAPRALVVCETPGCVFRHWGMEAEEGSRPDVQMLALPFAAYPGARDGLDHSPELLPLFDDFVARSRLDAGPLVALAHRRPVMLELGARSPVTLYPRLLPAGPLYSLVPGDPTAAHFEAARQQRDAFYQGLPAPGPAADRQSSQWQVMHHYMDALHAMELGQVGAARQAVASALAISPGTQPLPAMAAFLARGPQQGRRDSSPFRISPDGR